MPSRLHWFCLCLLLIIFTFLFGLAAQDNPARTLLEYLPLRETISCPSPMEPRRQLAFTPLDSTCVFPELSDANFDLSICFDTATCNAFTLTVRRNNDTSCVPTRSLSLDKELEQEIVSHFGPDDYRLDVKGAELYSTSIADIDHEDCTYRFDFALQNAGPASVQLMLLHSVSAVRGLPYFITYADTIIFIQHFSAFDEIEESWPLLHHLPLLIDPFILPSCPSCLRYDALPLPLPNQPDYHSCLETPFHASLPSCSSSSRLPTLGSYLPRPLKGLFADPLPLIDTVALLDHTTYLPPHFVGQYAFQPEGCMWRHDGMRFATHEGCMSEEERVIKFVGDSHARVAFDAIHNRLNGSIEYLESSPKGGDKRFNYGPTELIFQWDAYGDQLNDARCTCSSISELSALVVSIGSHAGSFGWTVARFEEALRFIPRIAACPQPLPPLILLLPPPQPPRQDEWFRNVMKDKRTSPRLIRFSEAIRKAAFETEVWSVVDQTNLLKPFEEYPMHTDGVHYLMTDGLEAVVDEVVGKARLCREQVVEEEEEAGGGRYGKWF